jgi:hypothetical protein
MVLTPIGSSGLLSYYSVHTVLHFIPSFQPFALKYELGFSIKNVFFACTSVSGSDYPWIVVKKYFNK